MKNEPVPFSGLSLQYAALRGEMDAAVSRVLLKGHYIMGDECAAFEREFAEYNGAAHAIGVGSGTEALHIALLSCGIKGGDEVVTAPNTAAPTVCAIAAAGAVPRFADIDPATMNMDPARLEDVLKKSGGRVKAVVPVHLYGRPARMDAILDMAGKYGAVVVEDVAQAAGASFNAKKTGSMGAAGCFSFYPTKNIGAAGDGGMLTTNDGEIARRARMIRNYGEESRFNNVTFGFNSRLDEIQAAILRVKLPHLDRWNARRRELAAIYANALGGSGLVGVPLDTPGAPSVYHLYVITCDRRDELMDCLKSQNIQTMVHYPKPAHLQKAFEYAGYKAGDLPVSEALAGKILSLPMYPELSDRQAESVARAVLSFCGKG